MPYQPALDGVRAFAVIAVVAFHAGAGWAPGGCLGVSVFFALSGDLITTVLLTEHAATGRIALGTFIGRRIRRLAPASLVTLAALALLSITGIGTLATGSDRHIRWAAAHLANWDRLTAESTYADAVDGEVERSPVPHFWSLAIEEQFYTVWPIVMIASLAILHRAESNRRTFVLIPAVALLSTWVFIAWLAGNGDAETIYLHSGSRAAEILTGCLLAVVLERRSSSAPIRIPLAQICAVAIVLAIVVTGSSSEAWPYRGGLPLFALLSAGLIAGLGSPSRFSGAVGRRPLVWIGRRRYGIYLYHWPIFVLVPLAGAGVMAHAVRLTAVVAVAAVSYRWIEQPIRTRSTGTTQTVMFAVAGAVVGIATEEDASSPRLTTDAAPAATVVAEQTTSTTQTTEAPADAEPFRMVVVGDSTAVAMSAGLVEWAEESEDEAQVGIAAHGACGLVRGGRYGGDVFNAALAVDCPHQLDVALPEILDTAPIDLVVVMITLADTWERTWDDGATWTRPTDPAHAERLHADYVAFVDRVTSLGAGKVVFVRPPVGYQNDDLDEPVREWSSGAQQVVDDSAAAIAAERDDVVVLDMRAFFEESGFDSDHVARRDGVHLTAEASVELARSWLGPALRDLRNS